MTVTMKVKQNAECIPVFIHDFAPTIPHFLQPSEDMRAVLFRTKNERFFSEKWLSVTTYTSQFDDVSYATDVDLESFDSLHDFDVINSMPDLPEPISIHDQEVWLECIDNEYSDFVHDFQELQYPDERMFG